MKLLICDDDISTIDVLQNQIDCLEMGISRILRAYNGKAAMDIIVKEMPELILCDIGMPQVDGMKVLKFVYEEEIPCEFAFITCYESFEFAKEAIRYGASMYINKPLVYKEVKAALKQMIDNIGKKNAATSKMTADLLSNTVFRQIRDGVCGTGRDQVDAFLRRNNMIFPADSVWRNVYALLDTAEAEKNGWQRETVTFSFARIMEENLLDYIGFANTLEDHEDYYEQVTCFIPEDQYTDDELMERCQRVISVSKSFLNLTPVLYIDEPAALYNMAVRYRTAKEKLYGFRLFPGNVFYTGDEPQEEGTAPQPNREAIERCLKERNREKYLAVIRDYLNRVGHEKKYGEYMMRALHWEIHGAAADFVRDNGLSDRLLYETESVSRAGRTAERSTQDMLSFAELCFDQAVNLLDNVEKRSDTISLVKNYIQKHYKEDISRDDVAAVSFVTPNYLSKLFVQEIGMNMREYINLLRVNEAKRLLITTDNNISDIAYDLGYNNISYFSTVFRRICGVSPVEWRNTDEEGRYETEGTDRKR